jgi:hypothetical protein
MSINHMSINYMSMTYLVGAEVVHLRHVAQPHLIARTERMIGR